MNSPPTEERLRYSYIPPTLIGFVVGSILAPKGIQLVALVLLYGLMMIAVDHVIDVLFRQDQEIGCPPTK